MKAKNQKITEKVIRKYLPKNIFNVEIDDNYIIIMWNKTKMDFVEAHKAIKYFCKNNRYIDLNYYCRRNIGFYILVKKGKETYDVISNKTLNLAYSDLFVSVRQRVNAFKYCKEFYRQDLKKMELDDILDNAYRFLNQHVDPNFIIFCATKEGISPVTYVDRLLPTIRE